MRYVCIVLFLVLTITTGTAQTIIKGNVKDAQGNPIPLANIKVLNSDLGTATNKDGLFILEPPASAKTLIVSAIGYATQNVAIDNQSAINIT